MIKFWIKLKQSIFDNPPIGTLLGIGVTAESKEEALILIKDKVYINRDMPEIEFVDSYISIDNLEENHVRPNIGNMDDKGIWFPLGYSD